MDVKTAMKGLPDVRWDDISGEFYRDYVMCSGQTIRIIDPLLLHVSASGGHYIIDAMGLTHYIPRDAWDSLTWFNKFNHPRCSFVSPKKGE